MAKYLLYLLLLVAVTTTGYAQNEPDSLFHIYVLMGQSNMAGRGQITEAFKPIGDPRVMVLTANGTWAEARHPLHFDKPKAVGVGPGLAFGMDMAAANPNIKIGLVPCAVGGTAIERWEPGAADKSTNTHPYDDALLRIKNAMNDGVIKGIIWHQGESNSSIEKAKSYLPKLEKLVARLRSEIGNPNLPIVVGELGRFKDVFQYVNAELTKVPSLIPNSALVTSEDLTHNGDQVHFDGKSATLLGHRFAEKMLLLQSLNKN